MAQDESSSIPFAREAEAFAQLVRIRELCDKSAHARDQRPAAAIEAVDAGMAKAKVAEVLGVARSTVDTWLSKRDRFVG